MFYQQQHTAFYSSFDVFPTHKGSGTHIRYFSRALLEHSGDLAMFTLGDQTLSVYEFENNTEIYRFKFLFDNYLERAKAFSDTLQLAVISQPNLRIAHFRDIWSGIPILRNQHKDCKSVYEVNALLSIELPQLYSNIHQSTLQKIIDLELECLEKSDSIITVSEGLKQLLIQRGAKKAKITVIPNGFDNKLIPKEVQDIPREPFLLYFGALQPWQGVDILIRAFEKIRIPEMKLVIIASQRKRNLKFYEKLVQKLGLEEKVIWRYELEQEELFTWIQNCAAVVAPLTDCARNSEQGCCPLKIIEAIGNGALTVASDLPPVRELLTHDVNCVLSRPNRPSELARTIELLLQDPEKCRNLRLNAQKMALEKFTWEIATEKLKNIYSNLWRPK